MAMFDNSVLLWDETALSGAGPFSSGTHDFGSADSATAACEPETVHAVIVVTTAVAGCDSLAFKIQDSADGASWADAGPDITDAVVVASLDAVGDVAFDASIGRGSLRRYVKFVATKAGSNVSAGALTGTLITEGGMGSDDKSGDAAPNPVNSDTGITR